jgi:hypothetical protein
LKNLQGGFSFILPHTPHPHRFTVAKKSFEGVLGVVRKSRGSPIFVFYCIFKTKFLKSFQGVHEVPLRVIPQPLPCEFRDTIDVFVRLSAVDAKSQKRN